MIELGFYYSAIFCAVQEVLFGHVSLGRLVQVLPLNVLVI